MPNRIRIHFNHIPDITQRLPDITAPILDDLTERGADHMRENFGSSPAPPGAFPGVDSGTLRRSIQVIAIDPLNRVILDGVPYGALLEFGTTTMAARPFMAPTAAWIQGEITAAFGTINLTP